MIPDKYRPVGNEDDSGSGDSSIAVGIEELRYFFAIYWFIPPQFQ